MLLLSMDWTTVVVETREIRETPGNRGILGTESQGITESLGTPEIQGIRKNLEIDETTGIEIATETETPEILATREKFYVCPRSTPIGNDKF
jgi:hypothetical protein